MARNHTTFHTWQSLQQSAVKQTARCSRLHLRVELAGFRKGRSCTEQIFILRNITEQSLDHQQDLVINFIDFKKAFDSVYRSSLWKILTYYGIPDRFINIFKALYDNCSCCVKTASGYTEFFVIVSGVRQDSIFSSFLFIIVINFIMRRTMDNSEYGIVWQKWNCLTDLDFADDVVIVAEEENVCQEMTTKLEEQSAQVGPVSYTHLTLPTILRV